MPLQQTCRSDTSDCRCRLAGSIRRQRTHTEPAQIFGRCQVTRGCRSHNFAQRQERHTAGDLMLLEGPLTLCSSLTPSIIPLLSSLSATLIAHIYLRGMFFFDLTRAVCVCVYACAGSQLGWPGNSLSLGEGHGMERAARGTVYEQNPMRNSGIWQTNVARTFLHALEKHAIKYFFCETCTFCGMHGATLMYRIVFL
jgi:hypothetical protein